MRDATLWTFAAMLAAAGCNDDAGGPVTASVGATDSGGATASDGAGADTEATTTTEAATTGGPDEPLGLGDRCVDWDDACGEGLYCSFGTCTWACGYAGLCCPEGQICGGIEWECAPPSRLWCGNACDGQAWHECEEGETCVVDEQGAGRCEAE